MSSKKFKGKWKIVEMEQWDPESDFYIEFDKKDSGHLHFLCVDACLDCRYSDSQKVEFTFHGHDEGDEVFGRGCATIKENNLEGYLYFHQGDESTFKAKLQKT
jgi:hypothetical protein